MISILMLLAVNLMGQTLPRWEQVHARQVRVWAGDPLPGTAVRIETFQNARVVRPLSVTPWVTEFWPEDTLPQTKVICFMAVSRADLFYPATGQRFWNVGTGLSWEPSCSTKAGQEKLLTDPALAKWYAAQL